MFGGSEFVTLTEDQMPAHAHEISDGGYTVTSGGGMPHPNMSPFTAINYVSIVDGVYPGRSGDFPAVEPMIGEIRMLAGPHIPPNAAPSDGRLLAVSGNDALFSLVGTIYGGDGRSTFGAAGPVWQGVDPCGKQRVRRAASRHRGRSC